MQWQKDLALQIEFIVHWEINTGNCVLKERYGIDSPLATLQVKMLKEVSYYYSRTSHTYNLK